jgi:hypothetical protein
VLRFKIDVNGRWLHPKLLVSMIHVFFHKAGSRCEPAFLFLLPGIWRYRRSGGAPFTKTRFEGARSVYGFYRCGDRNSTELITQVCFWTVNPGTAGSTPATVYGTVCGTQAIGPKDGRRGDFQPLAGLVTRQKRHQKELCGSRIPPR